MCILRENMKATLLIFAFIYANVKIVLGNYTTITTGIGCGCGPMDLLFALHMPRSSTDLGKLTNFTGSVVGSCVLGTHGIRVGLFTFGDKVREEFPLGFHNNTATLMPYIHNTAFHVPCGTRTDLALQYARQVRFKPRVNDSRMAPRVLVLVTDRLSNLPQATSVEADKLHRHNITVFVIGVGPYVSKTELNQIASDPRLVTSVQNFEALQTIETQLRNSMCQMSEFKVKPISPSSSSSVLTATRITHVIVCIVVGSTIFCLIVCTLIHRRCESIRALKNKHRVDALNVNNTKSTGVPSEVLDF